MDLEEKTPTIKVKFIDKGLTIFGFGIAEYYVRNESGHMIALQDQTHYIPELPKDLHIISTQGI